MQLLRGLWGAESTAWMSTLPSWKVIKPGPRVLHRPRRRGALNPLITDSSSFGFHRPGVAGGGGSSQKMLENVTFLSPSPLRDAVPLRSMQRSLLAAKES